MLLPLKFSYIHFSLQANFQKLLGKFRSKFECCCHFISKFLNYYLNHFPTSFLLVKLFCWLAVDETIFKYGNYILPVSFPSNLGHKYFGTIVCEYQICFQYCWKSMIIIALPFSLEGPLLVRFPKGPLVFQMNELRVPAKNKQKWIVK